MDILVRKKKGGEWEKVTERKFENEAALQTILYHSPEIIPFGELGILKPRLFVKEAGLPGSGNTDLIGVDEKGGITIIECKLAVNREIRRQVIGQVLEYAAYLWQMDYDQFDDVCYKAEKWTDKHLMDIIREQIGDTVEGWSEKDFIDNITSTLDKGDFPLIIAVDALNDELKRIIEFLNSRGEGAPKIHAVEISQFETSELEMLVPVSFGVATKPPERAGKGKVWNEALFRSDIKERVGKAELDSELEETILTILEFTKNYASKINWGKGTTNGSFTFRKINQGVLVSIFSCYSNGSAQISFGEMVGKGVREEVMQAFRNELNKIPDISIPDDSIKLGNKFPTIPVDALAKEGNLNIFRDAVLALCQQIES